MTAVMLGVCRNGQIAKSGEWKNPQTGQVHTGVGYTPCPKCDGEGCGPRLASVEDKVDALAKEVATLRRELAEARSDRED